MKYWPHRFLVDYPQSTKFLIHLLYVLEHMTNSTQNFMINSTLKFITRSKTLADQELNALWVVHEQAVNPS